MSSIQDSTLLLSLFESGEKKTLKFEWLRENCRCPVCYNATTNQRNLQLYDIPENVHPQTHQLSNDKLRITWNDGHESEYPVNWVLEQMKFEQRPQEVLWTGDISKKIEQVTATEFKSQHGASRLVKSLLEYGVGTVTEVENNLQATQDIVECIGLPQHTIFGYMWQLSDQLDHADTSYTNLALDAHTDLTYLQAPAGLIILHCIKKDCEGGLSELVDGFQGVHEVKTEAPDLYECLRTVKTEFQYIDSKKGYHLRAVAPVVETVDDRITTLRYNMYDRSSRVPQPESESGLYYRSLRRLTAALRRPEASWWQTLEPGTMLFVNNWRVLHGRTAYTGKRSMIGAYMSMGTLLSRARCLKLIR